MADASATKEWADAMAAFDAWAALGGEEREGWLQRLAVVDAALHGRVASLIRADEEAQANAFLAPAESEGEAKVAGFEGRRLGAWRIERLIGSGGMGHVWLARRADGLHEGLAAIKLMRLATGDAGADARFAREGRLLGRLSHPHIAHLLDAGVADGGERYLVLEYVEGERIDRWCDAHRLTVRQRIEMFIDVCKAVAHAHENLVVHRDLKPSNIVVATDGAVKLLDFGVAKLIEEDGPGAGDLTREAGAALTPLYAAPEQLNGGDVSTATDVYGLGVVLYGLLSGARPYASVPQGYEPSRPLWSLPADPRTAEQAAVQRATTVSSLRRTLHGDLAVVVAKAIKPDPAERYRAVPDLIDDLQRWLDRRPIAARPDSLGYRAQRYLQRHVFGAGAAAVIVAVLVAGITGTLVKQREATREAARAVAAKRFLLDLFEQARSSVQKDGVQTREATVNDMLAAGVDRVDHSFGDQPEIRDEVFQILVELVSDTGDRQQIIGLAQARLAAARKSFGADDVRTAPAEVMLGAVLLNFGETAQATPLLAHAETLLDRAGDRTSIERARLWRWQAILDAQTKARPPWASHPIRRAVDLLRARYAGDDELLSALAVLPAVACSYGQTRDALDGADELHARTIARYGGDNLFVDEANVIRGQLMLLGDRPADAVAPIEEAVAGFRRHVGEKSPNVVVAQADLAKAYLAAGRGEDSRRVFARAERALADEHPGDKRMGAILDAARGELSDIGAGKQRHCAR